MAPLSFANVCGLLLISSRWVRRWHQIVTEAEVPFNGDRRPTHTLQELLFLKLHQLYKIQAGMMIIQSAVFKTRLLYSEFQNPPAPTTDIYFGRDSSGAGHDLQAQRFLQVPGVTFRRSAFFRCRAWPSGAFLSSGAGHDLQAQRFLPTRRQTALYIEWTLKYRIVSYNSNLAVSTTCCGLTWSSSGTWIYETNEKILCNTTKFVNMVDVSRRGMHDF